MGINNLLAEYQYIIQALVAIGTLASVVVSLWLSRSKKAKITGELYYAITDLNHGGFKRATIKQVQSKGSCTFLLAEIKNTGDLDITLRNNKFEVVNSIFSVTIVSRVIVTLGLFKDEYIQHSDPRDYLLVPKRKISYFSSCQKGALKHNAIDDLKQFLKHNDIKNIHTTLQKLYSFRFIIEDELGQKFKLKISKDVINTLETSV